MSFKLICLIVVCAVAHGENNNGGAKDEELKFDPNCICFQKDQELSRSEIEEMYKNYNDCLNRDGGTYRTLAAPPGDISTSQEMETVHNHIREIKYPKEKVADLFCCSGKRDKFFKEDGSVNADHVIRQIKEVHTKPNVQQLLLAGVESCSQADVQADVKTCDMMEFIKCATQPCIDQLCSNSTRQ